MSNKEGTPKSETGLELSSEPLPKSQFEARPKPKRPYRPRPGTGPDLYLRTYPEVSASGKVSPGSVVLWMGKEQAAEQFAMAVLRGAGMAVQIAQINSRLEKAKRGKKE